MDITLEDKNNKKITQIIPNNYNHLVLHSSFHSKKTNSKNNSMKFPQELKNNSKVEFNIKKQIDDDIGKIMGIEESRTCKICLDVENEEKQLIHPCNCQGSMKYIHAVCLKLWLGDKDIVSNPPSCEICKHIYKINFVYEYFFSEKKFCVMIKNFLIVFSFLGLVLTLAIILIMVVISSTGKFSDEIRNRAKLIMIGIGSGILLMVILSYFRDCKKNYYEQTLIDWDVRECEKSI